MRWTNTPCKIAFKVNNIFWTVQPNNKAHLNQLQLRDKRDPDVDAKIIDNSAKKIAALFHKSRKKSLLKEEK